MSDPTYVKAEIDANPAWTLAWLMSEYQNDAAPIGWSRYIPLAEFLLDQYEMSPLSSSPSTTEKK